MPLSDIRKKLYGKKESREELEFLPDRFQPGKNVDNITRKEQSDPESRDSWEKPRQLIGSKEKKLIKWGAISLGIVLGIILIFFAVTKLQLTAFSSDKVLVSVEGPKETRSGKSVNYTISYENNTRVDLEDPVLVVHFPESFVPDDMQGFEKKSALSGEFELATIPSGEVGSVSFSGKIFSPKGSIAYLRVELGYKPSNFSSRFSSFAQVGTAVSSSPLSIEMNYPESVVSGDEVEYVVIYKNTGEEPISGIKIAAEYPEGFEFVSSDPGAFESNNSWRIENLASQKEEKLVIRGKLSGRSNEVKSLKVEAGFFPEGDFVKLSEESASIKIAGSNLFISQKVNNEESPNVSAGDLLKFQIFFRNDGNVGLRNIIVTEKLEGAALDLSTLDFRSGGSYDSGTGTITWKAVDYRGLENLEPGESGTIEFSVGVKEELPVKKDKDKNFVIHSLSKIDSPDIPTPIAMNKIISSDEMNMKVNSPLRIEVLGYYDDKFIPNTGPLPPVVDKDTTYTIHWKVSNISNDLKDAKVEAYLPTWASYTGKAYPQDSNIEFNERTNMLTWKIGDLKAGTGAFAPQSELAFQVKIRPAINQAGSQIIILDESRFSGEDKFTGENLSVKQGKKSSSLPEDPAIGANKGKEIVATD